MPNTPRSKEQADPRVRFTFSPPNEIIQDAKSHAPSPEMSPSSLPASSPDVRRSPAFGVNHGTRPVPSVKWHTAGSEEDTLANWMALLDAIYGGSPKRVSEILEHMEQTEVAAVLTACGFRRHDHDAAYASDTTNNISQKTSLIAHACLSGNVDVFDVVLGAMEARITKEQVVKTLTASAGGTLETLVEVAAKGGSQALFEKVILLLDGELLETTSNKRRVGSAIVRDAAVNGDANTFRVVTCILDKGLTRDQAMDAVSVNGEDGSSTILTNALYNGSSYEIAAWAEVLTSALPYDTVAEACTTTFSEACRVSSSRLCLEGLSVLIAYGADPPQQDLIYLSRVGTRDQLKHCFLGALTRVDNPMIPGLTLSIALGEAVKSAPAEQKLIILSLRHDVGEMLLDVLDRLPRAVRDFPGGFRGCAELFERGPTIIDSVGPLKKALRDGYYDHTLLCSAPLVADYISHKFVLDLPSWLDTESHFDATFGRNKEQRENLQRADLVAAGSLGKSMQGLSQQPVDSDGNTHDESEQTKASAHKWWDIVGDGGLALPGAQFIVVGVISKPYSYFKVPAMRMALDFMVYVGVVALFTLVTRLEEDHNLSYFEIFFVGYISDEIVSGISTMWGENFRDYWQDRWNWLNACTLVLLASSNLIRMVDHSNGSTVHSSSVHGLLALSAPLVFCRFLFFAQILRQQGLVIHTISLMVGELVQFGVVLAVVMMGFALSAYALFPEDQFSQIWLTLFKGILGDTSAFELFASGPYEVLATFLLVMYLVIMSIMLLNLLIAVLSTAHDKVTENTERESRASKVRIARFYRRVVDEGVLPAPLYLVQLAVCFPVKVVDRHWFSGRAYSKAKHAFGGSLFWLVSGPVAIVLGSILWTVSIPSAIVRVWQALKHSQCSVAFRVGRCCAVIPLHAVVAPLILVGLWLQVGLVGLRRGVAWASAQIIVLRGQQDDRGRKVGTNPNRAEQYEVDDLPVSVSDMLKMASDGQSLREIWAGLDDPFTKLSVRRDEARRPPTVQHMQILQRNLETNRRDEAGYLRASLESNDAAMLARVDGLERKLKTTLVNKMDDRIMTLEGRVREAVETRCSKLEDKLDKLLRKLQQDGVE